MTFLLKKLLYPLKEAGCVSALKDVGLRAVLLLFHLTFTSLFVVGEKLWSEVADDLE